MSKVSKEKDSINKTNTNPEIYRKLFSSIIYIGKTLTQKGCIKGNFDENKINTEFCNSRKLILLALELMYEGYYYPTFNYYINLEYAKIIRKISDIELTEFVLTSELIRYLYKGDFDAIYELICHVGTPLLRNEIVPTIDWINKP